MNKKQDDEKPQIQSDISFPFYSLAATENADKCSVYFDAIEWALQDKTIKNIAISGPYGSGKSSIIQTFEKEHQRKYSFLNISLATFKEEKRNTNIFKEENGSDTQDGNENIPPQGKNDDAPDEGNENLLRLIELSILQQMFFHEKESVLPDSRLKKIRKQSTPKNIALASFSTLFILSICILFFPDVINKIEFIKFLLTKAAFNNIIPTIIFIPGFIFGCIILIYKLSRSLAGISIKRLNINNAEIEMDSKVSKSILNHHLDEILYFFEATKYDVVVIEDLDRFEQTEIFTKLRELNLLINNSKKIERKIVFIYAIKDDMFIDKDRTKFFDFIIPIIPVIDFSNSETILNRINDDNKYELNNVLLEDLALFINDMRLLYNIMNEFYIYRQKINEHNKLDQNQLLSLVAYKNMYPSDFAQLSENKGDLYKAISSKQKLIQDNIRKIDEEIETITAELSVIQSQNISDITELRTIYIAKIIDKLSPNNFVSFNVNGKSLSISESVKEENFKKIIQGNINYYTYEPYSSYFRKNQQNASFSFSQIENEINPDLNYKRREELILENQNEIKQQVQNLNQQKKNFQKSSIKELLAENLSSSLKEKSNNNKQYELIYLFLRNGYIDENYIDYISVFHEGSLTELERHFLINVKLSKETDSECKLDNTEKLLRKIDANKFESASILNFNLVEAILKTENFNEKRNNLFSLLSNESKESITFIDKFINRTTEIEKFINELSKHWTNVWNYLFEKSNYPTEKLEKYFLYIIEHADISDIVSIFSNNKTFLNGYSNFLKIDINKGRVIQIIFGLNLKFKNLASDSPDDLMQYAWENNHYDFNIEIIKTILQKFDLYAHDTFETTNFHFVLNTKNQNFIKYVQENIEEYIEKIYLKLEHNTEETLDTYIELLHNKDINLSLKNKLIIKVNTIISDISMIEDDDVCELLLKHSKIEPKWENMLFYFEKENKFSPTLIEYLNTEENAKQLSYIHMITKKDDDYLDYSNFSTMLIHCLDININSYTLLTKSLVQWSTSFETEKLDYERIVILIENSCVSPSCYDYLKENFPDSHIKLIEKSLDIMLESINDLSIDENDLQLILQSTKIPDEKKYLFIDVCTDEIILENPENIKAIVKMKDFNQKVNRPELKINMMNNNNLSVNERIELFINNIELMNKELIDDFLTSFEFSFGTINQYGTITDKSKKAKLENNMMNRSLLTSLKNLEYISSFTEKGDKLIVNPKRI
jgi:hypothetical protein